MSLPILDVAIGISFIYLLLALICTTVNEMIAGWTKRRAAFLKRGITRLLRGDKTLVEEFYKQPLIQSLAPKDKSKPSYIPSDKFAAALTEVLPKNGGAQVREALRPLLAVDDIAAERAAIEKWFDDGMDRVSGWYKRRAQTWALIIACALTLVLNADTLHITRTLWFGPTVRAALVEEAKIRSQKARPEELLPMVEYPNPQEPTESVPVNVPEQALSENERTLIGQLTGWSDDWQRRVGDASRGIRPQSFWPWVGDVIVRHLLGWTLTAIALSMGAPFWFDVLNRFMNVRNAGRAPDERPDKSSPAKSAVGAVVIR